MILTLSWAICSRLSAVCKIHMIKNLGKIKYYVLFSWQRSIYRQTGNISLTSFIRSRVNLTTSWKFVKGIGKLSRKTCHVRLTRLPQNGQPWRERNV
jgi:hypothetical protein